ncbi:hypothetical protein VTK26DRAFT_1711 [Humicola hyalothermophila]
MNSQVETHQNNRRGDCAATDEELLFVAARVGMKACRKVEMREKVRNCPAKGHSQADSRRGAGESVLIKRQVLEKRLKFSSIPSRTCRLPCTDALSPSQWKSIEDSGVWLVLLAQYNAIGRKEAYENRYLASAIFLQPGPGNAHGNQGGKPAPPSVAQTRGRWSSAQAPRSLALKLGYLGCFAAVALLKFEPETGSIVLCCC